MMPRRLVVLRSSLLFFFFFFFFFCNTQQHYSHQPTTITTILLFVRLIDGSDSLTLMMDTHHQNNNNNNDDNGSNNNDHPKKKKKTKTKKNKSVEMISLEQVSPISIIRWICFIVVFVLVCQELTGIAVAPQTDDTTQRNNNDFTIPTTGSTETTTATAAAANSYPQQQLSLLLPPPGNDILQEEDRIRFIHRHLPFIENNDMRSSTITNPTTSSSTSTNPTTPTSTTTPQTIKTTFVFFIGLEGTGHHYVGDMIRNSPMIQSLITPPSTSSSSSTTRTTNNSSSKSSSSILTSQDLLELSKSLFYHSFDKENPTTGLFNAHCLSSSSSTKSKSKSSKASGGGANITALEENVRNQMISIHTKLQLHHNNNQQQLKQQHYYIPLNTLEEVSNSKWLGVGQLSYPNLSGKCRSLNYPQLDILYNTICNKHSFKNLNIDCVHVYLYRNPYSIIQSTKRRNFYSTSLEGIQLYITQLLIIYTQLSRYSKRTIECLTVLDNNNNKTENEEENANTTTTTTNSSNNNFNFNNQLNVIKQMFYTTTSSTTSITSITSNNDNDNSNDDNDDIFYKMLRNITHLPKQMTKQQQENLIPIEIQSYMNTMIQLHNDIIQLCQQSVIQNRQYVTSSTISEATG